MSRPTTPADKSFWGHLDDLRTVLIRMAIVLVVFMAGFFYFMPWLFDNVILAPCHAGFPTYRLLDGTVVAPAGGEGFEVRLINVRLASQFFTHMSLSFWLAIVFAMPVLIYQLWGFIRPALYDNELRSARTAFAFGSLMFFLGVAVGYFAVFPVTLRFLYTYELSGSISNMLSLDSYIDTFLMLNLMMGLAFELPLLAWALSAVGLLHRPFFNRYRRHAIVVLLILAAFITPTGDPFTLLVVFLPLYLLYELSALLVKKE